MTARGTQHFGAYRLAGICDFVLANRISYEYNLKGPRFVHIDNAIFPILG